MSGQLFPGRIDYLLGSNAGFKHLHGAILLAQAYPGATLPRRGGLDAGGESGKVQLIDE
jgi:hypothetical protein